LNKDNLHIARQKRGQIESSLLIAFATLSDKELANLLQSELSTERTVGATLLGERKAKEFVVNLCDALRIEKAIYSRIAICEALESIGKESIEPLSRLLGKIGKNQEIKLPEKYFEKKSYPLIRDIVARTLIRIGEPAIDKLIELSMTKDKYLLSQIIDTLGGLLHATGDLRILDRLTIIFEENRQNELLLWKTIRAFSAIESKETTRLIMPFLKHSQSAIRWETIRTLGLIANYEKEILAEIETFTTDSNEQIKQASINAINRLEQRNKLK
jgi:HEAT repeat protein